LKRSLKEHIFRLVAEHVEPRGFKFSKRRESFVKTGGGISFIFQLVFLDQGTGYRVCPHVGIRIDEVEEIFHQASGYEVKYQNATPTIGNSIRNILNDDTFEYVVSSDQQLETISQKLINVFDTFASQFYAEFCDIKKIDCLLNSSPMLPSSYRAGWLRCFTGVIVAKLSQRRNYDEIVLVYRNQLQQIADGFYSSNFEKIVSALDFRTVKELQE
jgi:hypothetical protein